MESQMKLLSIVCASLVASVAFALTAHTAFAANEHVCVSIVDWKDVTAGTTGHSPLGTSNVSGGTIGAAASQCHGNTLAAFVANKDWSAPDQICANTKGRNFKASIKVVVWALDQFQDTPGNWNRVEGYYVECGLMGNVPALGPTTIWP